LFRAFFVSGGSRTVKPIPIDKRAEKARSLTGSGHSDKIAASSDAEREW